MRTDRISFNDPLLSALKERLGFLERQLAPVPEAEADRIHAAVSVILREGTQLEILLIKRAESEGDPWSGQMALPGGRRDPDDETLFHTAIRETAEEVSIPLNRGGFHLGRLEPTIPATNRLPPITIFPYVFSVPEGTNAEPSSHEVDEVLWIPLDALRNPSLAGEVDIRYRDGKSRSFPCWRWDGRVIWGLTYRILTNLIQLIGEGRPDR